MAGENRCKWCGKFTSWENLKYAYREVSNYPGDYDCIEWMECKDICDKPNNKSAEQ